MNCWQHIYTHLKQEGFEVYSPGQHEGECTSPYVVVKDDGTTQFGSFSSTKSLYEVLCYVPKDHFSSLESFVHRVETSMIRLYPVVRPAHYKTPSFYDDTVKGHMVSVQYIHYKKLT